MTKDQIFNTLAAVPPSVGAQVLRGLADTWEADPDVINKLKKGEYEPVLTALAQHSPGLLARLLDIGFKLFT